MPQAVQRENAQSIRGLEPDVLKSASNLASDLSSLFVDIAKEIGGHDREGGHKKSNPVVHHNPVVDPPVGTPINPDPLPRSGLR